MFNGILIEEEYFSLIEEDQEAEGDFLNKVHSLNNWVRNSYCSELYTQWFEDRIQRF